MIAMLSDRSLRGQLIRYGATGGVVTLFGVAAYALAAAALRLHPQIANLIGFAVAVVIGYGLHSRISFRGHGGRDAPAARTARFAVVSLVSYGLNSGWVWLLTGLAGGPFWWAIPFMVGVTPVATFALNRQWVFR